MAQVLNQQTLSPTGQQLYVSGATPLDVTSTISRINPNTSSTINPDMLGTTPLNIRPTTSPTIPNIASLPGSGTAPTTATGTGAGSTTPPAGQTNTFTDKLSGLVAKFTGKAQEQQIAEQTATAPLEQQKAQLGAQIKRLQADTLSQQEAAINRVGGSPAANSYDQQQIARTHSIQGLLLQSQIDSLSGDIASAKTNADLAVETKYSQIQQDIQKARDDIYNNWESFSGAEKKRASAALAQLDANDQYAKQNIEDEKAIQAMAAAALSNNPGNQAVQLAVNEATKTGDLAKATELLGQYQTDPVKAALQRAQLANTLANTAHTNAETANLNSPGGGKPPTATQETTALYANRLEQSNAIISGLDQYASTANPLSFAAQQRTPDFLNQLKSGNFQSLDQAQRNFINATLRRESGASISPTEFDSAKKQYFALPGDTPQVVAQKKANRDLVTKGFISGSGTAYTPLDTIAPTNGTALSPPKGTDGALYSHPGYVSDGTQWVLKK